jgi:hypothetical protein
MRVEGVDVATPRCGPASNASVVCREPFSAGGRERQTPPQAGGLPSSSYSGMNFKLQNASKRNRLGGLAPRRRRKVASFSRLLIFCTKLNIFYKEALDK